jgi:hypothetical protein
MGGGLGNLYVDFIVIDRGFVPTKSRPSDKFALSSRCPWGLNLVFVLVPQKGDTVFSTSRLPPPD